MFAGILTVVALVLLLNLLLALVVIARRAGTEGWLLVVLLGGTGGAAVIALLALPPLLGEPRLLDVGLVLTGLAALTAAVRSATTRPDDDAARPGDTVPDPPAAPDGPGPT